MPGLGPFFALCAAGLGGVYRLEFRPWGLSLGLKVPGVQGLELELCGRDCETVVAYRCGSRVEETDPKTKNTSLRACEAAALLGKN